MTLLASLAKLDPSKDKSAITLRPVLLASLVRKHDDAPARKRILVAIGPKAPLAERLLVISAIGGAANPEWLVPHLTKLEEEDPNAAIRKKAGLILQQLTDRGALAHRVR
ncbi:MAG: hypothetical protein JKY65_34215 [Planctomycetes bacterium]|nr:hypothetical protein [Planctomycetota bacterium]